MSRSTSIRIVSFSIPLLCVALGGCGSKDETCDGPADLALSATPEGILAEGVCSDIHLVLRPRALVQDRWRGGGEEGPCTAGPDTVTCPAGEAGSVTARLAGSTVQVEFTPTQDATLQALSLQGEGRIEGAAAWLSNGFQSWSQSGMVAIQDPPTENELERALTARGDGEVIRWGNELSWFYTAAGGDRAAFLAAALTADRFKPWVQIASAGESGRVSVRIVSGGTGEAVRCTAGNPISSEVWHMAGGTDPAALLSGYGQALPSRRDNVVRPAEAGWNSWYELFDEVDEQAVRDNAALAADILGSRLPPSTPVRIVVDDGWQRAWGDWEPNDKFPSGLDGLAAELKAQGFEMGVWLAPLLVEADHPIATGNPEWFVQDVGWAHMDDGPMRILDPTHPGAAAHLQSVIARIVSWGYTLLKIDFLFTGTFEGRRHEPVTGMEAYGRALALIREAAGEDTVLLAVGAPALPTFQYADAWRLGSDICFASGPAWPFIVNQARSISARWHLCHATLCDADPVLLRALDREEVEAGAWVVALSGGALFLSDDLPALQPERHAWGLDADRVDAAIGAVPSIPQDLFPSEPPLRLTNALLDYMNGTNEHVLPMIWQTPSGLRIGLNPWEDERTVESTSVPPHSVRILSRP